ncbi:MAG: tRNA (adenosine(37)-N6)-threonylcarbamoyltransferase complex dimerization subunit type 1 TsaB [Limnohabitans sp.]|nr:tRNA (adenosine(37)-N6)-threonylcarbamoyltransferase complex dimerization subunit type 1 TsaB [Limnohabitans sp.]
MAYILHLETATRNCSVSVAENGKTIFCQEIAESGYSHAEKLHLFIEEVLTQAKITFNELNAIAVSQGPGSYTGLRIGVSAAKGFCYGLQIPLIAIDTLEVLARKINRVEGVIVPMIDARRMECYTAVFDSEYRNVREVQSEIITETSFSDISEKIHLVGDGAMKCKEVLKDEKFIFYPELEFPSANEMSFLAYEKYKINDTVDVAYFEPFYLKDFILNSGK